MSWRCFHLMPNPGEFVSDEANRIGFLSSDLLQGRSTLVIEDPAT
jgi:hypothetical protein